MSDEPVYRRLCNSRLRVCVFAENLISVLSFCRFDEDHPESNPETNAGARPVLRLTRRRIFSRSQRWLSPFAHYRFCPPFLCELYFKNSTATDQQPLHPFYRRIHPLDILSDIACVKLLIEGDAWRNAALMKSSDPHPLVLSISPKTQKGHLYR